jgi:hypothetical protein
MTYYQLREAANSDLRRRLEVIRDVDAPAAKCEADEIRRELSRRVGGCA